MMSNKTTAATHTSTDPPGGEPRRTRRVTSVELLGESSEMVIVHGEQEYRLRKTRQGKLILIK